MRGNPRTLNCVLASLALCMGVEAMVADSSPAQYKSIENRNLFGLRPAPVKIIDPPPPPALPKITLSGITDILGRKLAIMKVSFPSKPGEPAREQSYMLAQGQRDGDIEVLEVNEKAGTVKVNNFGTVMTLTFDKDGPKSAAAPGAQLSPTGANPIPSPNATNPPTPTGNSNTGKRTFLQRNAQLSSSTGQTAPTQTNTSNATSVPPVAPALPTNAQPQPAPQERPLTPEEQVVVRELEREAAKQQLEKSVLPGTPASAPPQTAPPPPPTELSPQ